MSTLRKAASTVEFTLNRRRMLTAPEAAPENRLTLEDARHLATRPAATFERATGLAVVPPAPSGDGHLSQLQARTFQDGLRGAVDASKVHAGGRDDEKARVTEVVVRALQDGSAVKLATMPHGLRGKRPTVTDISDAGSGMQGAAWLTHGMIYFQRASQTPSPLTGWWRIGTLTSG